MRAILVHAGHDSNCDSRIETALNVARATGGHVTLHINTPITAYVTMDPFGGSHVLSDIMNQVRERAAALAERLEIRLAREDIPWSIEMSEADLTDALVSNARLADLVVMSLGETVSPMAARPPVGGVAIGARAPVLALPDGVPFMPGGTAVVAWNGSHESAHALRAAVPLLRLGNAVHLVTIAERDQPLPPTEAAAYLSRHDIHAAIVERQAGTQTVEEALLAFADEVGAALMVMGAYGHSRLRETLFGGVTRFAIDSGTRPLLLMH
jgi:nucleotide-binding universal stress UspA family protein